MRIAVTGASQGIGRAVVHALIAEGHTVFGVSRSHEKLREISEQFPAETFLFEVADLGVREGIDSWIDAMRKAKFVPDIVVFNAGVQKEDMFHDGYRSDDAMTVLNLNLKSPLISLEKLLPDSLSRKRGRFVSIGSAAVLRPTLRSASYAASKAGIAMAFRALDQRYRPQGVTFGCIHPGPIATSMLSWGGSMLIPHPERVAPRMARFILSRRRILWVPWLSTTLLRLTLWISDRWFFSLFRFALRRY